MSSPSRWGRALDALLWAAVIASLTFALWPRDSGPPEGALAPSFELPVVTGEGTFLHEGTRERPLLIEAFASWCGACRRDRHVLDSVHEATLRGRLDAIAISLDDDAANAREAARSWPIRVPVLHDADGRFARKYQVDVLPTYILIGTDGRVSHVRSGTAGASDLRTWLNQAEAIQAGVIQAE